MLKPCKGFQSFLPRPGTGANRLSAGIATARVCLISLQPEMEREGPILESLTRRLAETPEEFLSEPRIGLSGRVHVAAVVYDLTQNLNVPFEPVELSRFAGSDARLDRNRLAIALLFCWLL